MSASFTILDPQAPRRIVDPDVGRIAQTVASDAAAGSPRRTGTLAAGYHVEHGRAPAVYRVVNRVRYAPYVEFGTSVMAANPAFGRAVAAARARYS